VAQAVTLTVTVATATAEEKISFRSFAALGRYLGRPPAAVADQPRAHAHLQPRRRRAGGGSTPQAAITLAATRHAAACAEARARAPAARPAKRAKPYNGLGVHSWDDLDRAMAKGGWSLSRVRSNVRWTRIVPHPAVASTPDAPPLVQHLFRACSPSDNFHGPQKAATTMRRLDRE
jgi:hypothetical protein